MSNILNDTPRNDYSFLIIEDETDIAELLSLYLKDLGGNTTQIHDGAEGLAAAVSKNWDLIILDLRLPGMDGIDICRTIRNKGIATPIMMLTARTTELDRVLGLEIGADDYLTKPFSAIEFQARAKALLRRSSITLLAASQIKNESASNNSDIIRHGELMIHKNNRQVTINDSPLDLTVKEYDLLLYFAENPDVVFRRSDLLDKVWGYHHQGYEHTVNSHINRLRSKLEKNTSQPDYIHTVWGVGYRFSAPKNSNDELNA